MSQKKQIAIYGGAFNPPHIGHAATVETVLRLFPCDELWLMPSQSRSDKTIDVTGAQRVEMLGIMAEELFPGRPIEVSRFELELPGHTITYNTMKGLKNRWPEHEFHLIISTEILGDMLDWWEKGKELYTENHFIVVERPGYPLKVPLPPASVMLKGGAGWIEISSTHMRDLLSQGERAVPYITPRIADYIHENRLYNIKKS